MAEIPMTADDIDIAANLAAIRDRIVAAESEAGRPAGSVALVAVTKAHPAECAAAALAAGHQVFGENRVQEAKAKWPPLKEQYRQATLHLIGPLQTNKARDAVALFDTIETLDRPKLARALADEMTRAGRRVACYIEVNTGEEAQKSGVLPGAADAFIEACRRDYELPVDGLMCIPPQDEEPALHFALLAQIARRNGVESLSMGMTADFPTAIGLGATHVRIGTAIFGPRVPWPG